MIIKNTVLSVLVAGIVLGTVLMFTNTMSLLNTSCVLEESLLWLVLKPFLVGTLFIPTLYQLCDQSE